MVAFDPPRGINGSMMVGIAAETGDRLRGMDDEPALAQHACSCRDPIVIRQFDRDRQPI